VADSYVEYPSKRALDLLAAIAMAVLVGPFIILAAFAIRVESRGPVIFRQLRVGRNEVPFVCYKLRTMKTDVATLPTHEIPTSSITRVGRLLRRIKLDEIPQLVNIFRGEMSLVGPRPCLTVQHELVEERRRLGVNQMRPGLTGVSQVAGVDMSDPRRLAELDATYRDSASLSTDLALIGATIFGDGRGDPAQARSL
jgi:O-antigen biosynthesis protein WbqP